MSSNERSSFSIQRMSAAHVEQALRMCRASGWNQLREDWQRLIAYEPDGCFVATCDGQLAGTVTTTRYGPELGWIGMMLVHPEFRRRGIATALMQQSVDYLRNQRVQSIKLDATPAGQPVYKKLGFDVEWTFYRWRREGAATETTTIDLPGAALDLPTVLMDLDREAFGADRSAFLRLLADGSLVHTTDGGFGMLRPGFLASYLGPVCAKTPQAAEPIIAELCARTGGAIFWDIPTPNGDAIRMAEELGFTPVRELTRMCLGDESRPNLRLQYALADPGTG